MSDKLTTQQICALRGKAQTMDPVIKVGKQGLTPGFLKSVDEALNQHELIKVKFADLKDQKRVLSPQLAEQTQSTLITLIGNVLVLYRQHSDPAKRKVVTWAVAGNPLSQALPQIPYPSPRKGPPLSGPDS